jgi:Protein of unknown function (DUF3987)
VAASGERKSTVDAMALAPIRLHEEHLRGIYEIEIEPYRREKLAYDAQVKSIEKRTKTSKDEKLQELRDLGNAPKAPQAPIWVCEEPTFEGLCKLLTEGHATAGLFTDEGGQFVGGHAMKDDNHLRCITGLSKLWDGDALKRIRAGEGYSTLKGKRLSAHLMMQPEVAHGFLSNALNKGQGVLARFLVCSPATTMGSRPYKPSTASHKHVLERYNAHLLNLLKQPLPYSPLYSNELNPTTLVLSPEAKALLVGYHDAVEAELAPTGELHHISGFGAKLAENTARIAGVLTAIERPDASVVDEQAMANAIEIAGYYQSEALRLNSGVKEDEGILKAQKLLAWLNDRWEDSFVSRACIQNKVPYALRQKQALDVAFNTLVAHGTLIPMEAPVTINGHTRKEAFRIVKT